MRQKPSASASFSRPHSSCRSSWSSRSSVTAGSRRSGASRLVPPYRCGRPDRRRARGVQRRRSGQLVKQRCSSGVHQDRLDQGDYGRSSRSLSISRCDAPSDTRRAALPRRVVVQARAAASASACDERRKALDLPAVTPPRAGVIRRPGPGALGGKAKAWRSRGQACCTSLNASSCAAR